MSVFYAEEPGRDYRKERDAAYTERNRLVAALARLIPLALPSVPGVMSAWLAEHDPTDAGWDPEWRTIVFIEGPTGQLSWHLHDSDVPLFEGLPLHRRVVPPRPARLGEARPMRLLALVALALSGCATARTCTQPLTGQAIQDGAGVLTCAASGKTLAACEDAQLAVEAGQLTADLLVCGEVAIAAAAKGDHTTAGK